jgi:Tfp pilus assembly protein PilZ
MNTILKEQIKKFYESGEVLEARMKDLSKYFLYGGYINVRNQYHIYIKTVEFYYHEEVGDIKDPIMYHRNDYFVKGNVPYFTPLSFNSHDTGVDITFENEEKKIRASVLIRAYEVFDCKNGTRLVWNPAVGQFQEYVGGKTKYNTQCLYLKRILNGFTSEGTPDITWVDDLSNLKEISDKDIMPICRKGVFESENDERYMAIKGKRNNREWGFRREKDIILQ